MNRTDRLYALVEELRAAAPQWRSASSLAFRLDRIASATILDERVPDRGLDPADLELPDVIGRGILGEMNRQESTK